MSIFGPQNSMRILAPFTVEMNFCNVSHRILKATRMTEDDSNRKKIIQASAFQDLIPIFSAIVSEPNEMRCDTVRLKMKWLFSNFLVEMRALRTKRTNERGGQRVKMKCVCVRAFNEGKCVRVRVFLWGSIIGERTA